MMRKCLNWLTSGMVAICLLATTFYGGKAEASSLDKSSNPLGINLASITDWSSESPFKDVFKTARPWNLWIDGRPNLTLDNNGWVKDLNGGTATTRWNVNVGNGSSFTGNFVMLWDGEGTFTLEGDAVNVQDGGSHRKLFTVNQTSGSGVELNITATDPNNYIRNIRVMKTDYEGNYASDPWNPVFISHIVDKFNTLRFMDWMATNNNETDINWNERRTKDYYTQSEAADHSKSVAIEYMVDLANRTHSNMWINIPHKATNDYVYAMASYIKDNLDPSLKVYVEYSNEVWNSQFIQYGYANAQGLAQGLSTNEYEAGRMWYAKRSSEIFDLFDSCFGGTSRLVRVLASIHGGSSGSSWTSELIMDTQVNGWSKAYQHADALAVAPYYGYDANTKFNAGSSQSDVLNYLESESLKNAAVTKQHADAAAARGLELIAYEGGQHLSPYGDATLESLFSGVNRNWDLWKVYYSDLTRWKDSGGHLYVAYNDVGAYSAWGSWGALEAVDQTGSPKYDAIMQWISEHPRWW